MCGVHCRFSVLFCAAAATASRLHLLDTELTSIHFIGDVHGDVECAKAWVARTGAIEFSAREPSVCQYSMANSSADRMFDRTRDAEYVEWVR